MLKCQIFGDCERAARCKRTLDNRVAREVQEHNNVAQYARVLKALSEILGDVLLNAHCGKYHAEVVLCRAADFSLTYNLYGEVVVLHTRARENRKLLTSDKRHKRVDC